MIISQINQLIVRFAEIQKIIRNAVTTRAHSDTFT